MKRWGWLFGAGLMLAGLPAHAVKLEVRMSPQALAGNGFRLTTREEAGTTRFKLTRDLSKAEWPDRSAMLLLPGENGKSTSRTVEGEKRGNRMIYRFSVPSRDVSRAHLRYAEIQTGPGGERILGGGTFFEFDLADYLEKPGGK